MNLGATETYEVWFIPANQERYSTRALTDNCTLSEARKFVEDHRVHMRGELQIVRVTVTRQQLTP